LEKDQSGFDYWRSSNQKLWIEHTRVVHFRCVGVCVGVMSAVRELLCVSVMGAVCECHVCVSFMGAVRECHGCMSVMGAVHECHGCCARVCCRRSMQGQGLSAPLVGS